MSSFNIIRPKKHLKNEQRSKDVAAKKRPTTSGVGKINNYYEDIFSVIWQEEIVPRQWREGLIVNIFKKGDREDPANYRGITLLSVVGKVFCKILNNRLVQCLDKEGALHEGQAGFRINRSCMDNVYTLNEIVQGRLREDMFSYLPLICLAQFHLKCTHYPCNFC